MNINPEEYPIFTEPIDNLGFKTVPGNSTYFIIQAVLNPGIEYIRAQHPVELTEGTHALGVSLTATVYRICDILEGFIVYSPQSLFMIEMHFGDYFIVKFPVTPGSDVPFSFKPDLIFMTHYVFFSEHLKVRFLFLDNTPESSITPTTSKIDILHGIIQSPNRRILLNSMYFERSFWYNGVYYSFKYDSGCIRAYRHVINTLQNMCMKKLARRSSSWLAECDRVPDYIIENLQYRNLLAGLSYTYPINI